MKRYDYELCTCDVCQGSVSFVESETGDYTFYAEAVADRAALVAQVAGLTRERDEAIQNTIAERGLRQATESVLARTESEVTRLTRERDEVLQASMYSAKREQTAESEVTRLTEALAAAERKLNHESYVSDKRAQERNAAEARVRELTEALAAAESEKTALADTNVDLCDARRAAEARVGESEERVARASASAIVADTQLAAANALLEWLALRAPDLVAEGNAHLAAQPATAPALRERRALAETEEVFGCVGCFP